MMINRRAKIAVSKAKEGFPELPKSAFSPFTFIAVCSNSKPLLFPGLQTDGAWGCCGESISESLLSRDALAGHVGLVPVGVGVLLV